MSVRVGDLWAIAPLLMIPMLMATGQLLFKMASQTAGLIQSSPLLSFATNPFLLFALAVYFLTTLWWVMVLRTTPLGYAYAFMALSFLYVPLFSWIVFGERFGWRYLVGVTLILGGILLATSDGAKREPRSKPAASVQR